MSDEVRLSYDSGYTIYFEVRNSSGQVAYLSGQVFEEFGTGGRTITSYSTELTDKSGFYVGDFPTWISKGRYTARCFVQAGSTPASDDAFIGDASIYWSGSGAISNTSEATSGRTRSQIKTIVDGHTGRATEKDTLIDYYCDEALKIAVHASPFRDAQSVPDDLSITEDTTTVDISSIGTIVDIISARIIEASSGKYSPLVIRDRVWWDKNIVSPNDNQKGWPKFAIREGDDIVLDRPPESGLTLRLRVTTEQTFESDDSPCPIALLDIFVTQYVTAMVFLSVENTESYQYWMGLAMGRKYLVDGTIGGLLGAAIMTDKIDEAEEFIAERRGDSADVLDGIAIENLNDWHDDYGNTRVWY